MVILFLIQKNNTMQDYCSVFRSILKLKYYSMSALLFHNGLLYSAVLFCFAAGFALQAYRGTQKPSPMEVMKTQTTRLADSPATQAVAPPKMEIPTVDGRRQGARPHKLKPRDMNILTPSGFWRAPDCSPLHFILNVSPNHAAASVWLRSQLAASFTVFVHFICWPRPWR